jgi:hypothetical protein
LTGIAVLDGAPLRLRDLGFQRDDGLGFGGGILVAGQRQHLLDVDLVLGAGVRQARFVLQVEVAVRHAQAGLRDVDDVAGRILVVLVDAHVDRRAGADALECAATFASAFLSFRAAMRASSPFSGARPSCVAARLVHVAGVEVAHLLGVRAGFRVLVLGGLFDQGADLGARPCPAATLNAPQLERSLGMSTSFSHLPCE